MIIYVVLMNLWGNPHSHSYILPKAFRNKDEADKAGREEGYIKGLRYEHLIQEVTLND